MTADRRAAVALVAVLALGLSACAPALPESVVPGTTLTVGWSGEVTSFNAAASPTPGNIDIAAATRDGFGEVVDGEFVADPAFGEVSIVDDDPFVVRYDLAEPSWSDGIPLDAADLVLSWAAASDLLPADGDEPADPAEPGAGAVAPVFAPRMPRLDEFARAIEVTFARPSSEWQTAVGVPVPAHVVGAHAFGLDDPMEAKQAVIAAIRDADPSALRAIGTVWREGFVIDGGNQVDDLRISSGPFQVDDVQSTDEGQRVALVPNPSYRGSEPPRVARVELVPPGDDPISEIGERIDVARIPPIAATRAPVRDRERQDFPVVSAHDGTIWAVLLRPSGVFGNRDARSAFLRSVPGRSLVERGGGEWASLYAATTSMVTDPGSRAYEIVNEDSGFATSLGTPPEDPALEREAAGIAAGTSVCVLYDRGAEFAVGAFAALRDAVREAGWNIADCGSDDVGAVLGQGRWDAAITRVALPTTPAQLADQWGSQGPGSLTGHADAGRDALFAQLAATTDVYAASDVRAQIEASIVAAAVALPLATNPIVVVADRGISGIVPRAGDVPLTAGLAQWVDERGAR